MRLVLRHFKFLSTELKVILMVLTILVCLPAVAVIAMANSGLSAVSSALATLNPITHKVEIKDPDGKVIATLDATTVWPVKGAVTTEFGADDSPYQKHHTGIDIASKLGDPITPFMAGTVTKVDTNPNNNTGYGEYVVVDNGNSITSLYGHMSLILTSEGKELKPGDTIGLEGSTGHSTGPHVHFEIRVYGIPVDPRIFMVGEPTT